MNKSSSRRLEKEKLKKLLIQAIKFIGISGIGWIMDFVVYSVLAVFSRNLVLNNTISSWIGATFVFLFATRKVFQSNSRIPLKWKYLVYILYQCVLIYFSSNLLNVINIAIVSKIGIEILVKFSKIIAKILVTPVTMTLNFFVMKYIIEKM